MHSLAPLPPAIVPLTNEESEWLERLDDSLPKSPAQCVTCGGRKSFQWYDYAATGERLDDVVTYACPCSDQWVLNRYLLMRGIGTAWQRLEWADAVAVPEDAIKKTMDYLGKHKEYLRAGVGFILYGAGRGTGKSMTGALLAKTLVALGHDVHWTMFHSMIEAQIPQWKDKSAARWYEQRIRNVDVLVVDDMGREHGAVKSGDSPRFTIEDAIRHRTNNAKPTIITTNIDISQMEAAYGSHLISVLRERAVTCKFEADDWRDNARHRLVDEITLGLSRPIMLGRPT